MYTKWMDFNFYFFVQSFSLTNICFRTLITTSQLTRIKHKVFLMVSRTGRTVKKVEVQPKPTAATVSFDIDTPNPTEKESAIMNTIEQDLIDQVVYEDEMRFRTMSGMVSLVLALLGVMLVLVGRAETPALTTEDGPIFWLEIMGYTLLLPLLVWFIFICCPTKSERRQRHNIKKRRTIRLKEYSAAEVEATFVDEVALKKRQQEKERKRKEEKVIIQAGKDDKRRREENRAKAQRQKLHQQKEARWMEENNRRKQNAFEKYNDTTRGV
jgi:hypothetical protein